MAKTTVVRTSKLFTMYRKVARHRGRGCKFQWNAKTQYIITYSSEKYKSMPTKVFKTLEEANKEWVYLTLRYA